MAQKLIARGQSLETEDEGLPLKNKPRGCYFFEYKQSYLPRGPSSPVKLKNSIGSW